MYKTLGILIIVGITYLLIFQPFKKHPKTIEITIGSNKIDAELAITPIQQTKGLMFRKNMDKNKGMLFVFKYEAKQTFWMANTYIPLDIIWINKDKKIININQDTQPCNINSLCKTYYSKEKVLYVLETNAGYTKENNIKIGNQVIFDTINL